ncbi:MAG: hypothetical protein H6679_03890 [Epsilonproteobacteria bacterium]|nr:hypothetical protein [Campylobacterota bacterium]
MKDKSGKIVFISFFFMFLLRAQDDTPTPQQTIQISLEQLSAALKNGLDQAEPLITALTTNMHILQNDLDELEAIFCPDPTLTDTTDAQPEPTPPPTPTPFSFDPFVPPPLPNPWPDKTSQLAFVSKPSSSSTQPTDTAAQTQPTQPSQNNTTPQPSTLPNTTPTQTQPETTPTQEVTIPQNTSQTEQPIPQTNTQVTNQTGQPVVQPTIQPSLPSLEQSRPQTSVVYQPITELGPISLYYPAWIQKLIQTSPEVTILYDGTTCCAPLPPPDTQTAHFVLEIGDHNLWYGPEGALWGYDKCGRIFYITVDGDRVTQNIECPCDFLLE